MLDVLLHKIVPFHADKLLAKARRKAGSDDFGEPDLQASLTVLLSAFEQQANLTAIGRVVAFNDVLALLVNRLRLQADRQRWPDIDAEAIVKPIFITGLPRTGTTLLHGLLAADPRSRAPLTWEVMSPSPPPATASSKQLQRRQRRARTNLRWLDRLAPGFQAIHEVGADLPQECIAITAHTMLSLRFLVTYGLPDYAEHLAAADMRPAYRWHRNFLQQLQFGNAALRWVLKAPGHLADLDALLAEYPDAVVIQTHRDPLKTIPSLASLRLNMRSAFARDPDPIQIGAEVSDYWSTALQRSQQVRSSYPAETFIDVCYDDLTSSPAATLTRVYCQLGLDVQVADVDRWQAYLQHNPQGKHGVHSYRSEDFGLSASGLAEQFHDYRQAHGWT